jgi:hypothetical protein
MLFKSRFIMLGVVLSGVVQAASASILLSSEVDVLAGNNYYETTLAQDGYVNFYTNYPTASLQNYQTSFTGMNSTGGTQTMDVTASASAEAAAGVLKSSSSLTITNPYYNAANPIYLDPSFTVNPNGSPDIIEVDTQAKFDDSLLVDAAGTLSTLKVFVSLTGTITDNTGLGGTYDDPFYTQASLAVTDASGHTCTTCGTGNVSGTGTYDQTFELNIPVTDPNAVDLGILMYMYNWFSPGALTYDESGSYTSTMDFSHTLQITGIQGLDSSGQNVPLNSVMGSAGDYYPIASVVPLPATVWLFGSGLLGLVGIARRKNTA